jgi:short-subunit dehydrogenase
MKNTFITGASSGLGRGLALELASPGARIGVAARRAELLEELVGEIEQRGAEAKAFVLDVTDLRATQSTAQAYLAWAGRIDCVIANAGIGESSRRAPDRAERVAEVFAVNTVGVTNTLLSFLPAMKEQRSGTLVAMGSFAGFRAVPGSASYSASKAAVYTFVEALRMELLGSGVHAMTICPGFVRTPMTDKNHFTMPFLMEPDDAARLMLRAIARQDDVYTFPWQWRLLAKVVKLVPEWAIVRFAPRKTRE